jgi:hypothetical protein
MQEFAFNLNILCSYIFNLKYLTWLIKSTCKIKQPIGLFSNINYANEKQ